MKKTLSVLASLLLAGATSTSHAAQILDSYNVQAYKNSELILSGSFSVLHDDRATVSVYAQTATLQSANFTLGSTMFTLANTCLFKNTPPISYNDRDLYQLYGIVGTGLGRGTGVGAATDDFTLMFNPYMGTTGNLLYARANPAIGGTFADRIVLTPATAAVPEPASWGMMILGVGLTGGTLRRRTRCAKVRAA